ncbi:MAG: 16S rRNA (cytosine(1402)-N(4))-methyltransferase, partial [Spirochaetota bacterium]|nr:16S rRNA (cytosine(1402)-N(4))-methyltransferase [Spirochaetota bacterium]
MNTLKTYTHTPILVNEILNYFPTKQSNVIVDCTVGEGGHSEFFLSRLHGGKLIVLDRDKEILDIARKRLSDTVKNEDIS